MYKGQKKKDIAQKSIELATVDGLYGLFTHLT
jgi:hypothetical protein